MNAHAHLLSLGWAGPGHALDSRPSTTGAAFGDYKQKGHRGLAYDPKVDPAKVGNTGAGLVRPLSISKRKDRFGIGKKAHEPASGNQWWLKGFENALGNIGKSESERSGTTTPVLSGPVTTGKHGGLYGFFVKGQLMEGTIIEREETHQASRKRKSDVLDDTLSNNLSAGEGENPSTNKKRVKPDKTTVEDFAVVAAFLGETDSDDRKNRRKQKDSEFEQFKKAGEYFEIRENVTKNKMPKHLRSGVMSSENTGESIVCLDTHHSDGNDEEVETKEQRRERRRKRKEEKAAKAQSQDLHQKSFGVQQIQPHDDTSDVAARIARKAERKRRKAEKASIAGV